MQLLPEIFIWHMKVEWKKWAKFYSQVILVFKTPSLRSCYLNRSVNYIIKNLKSTLEKIDFYSTEVDLLKLYEVKTMEKLIALDLADYKYGEKTA